MDKDLKLKLLEMVLSGDNVEDVNEKSKNEITFPIDSYVIVRCKDAGVHYGILDSVNGRTVRLTKTRRMHRWWAKTQMSLSAVAEFGLNETKKLRIQNELDEIILLDACEIIKCSKECIESFLRVEPYNEQ